MTTTPTLTDERTRQAKQERVARNAGAMLTRQDIADELNVNVRSVARYIASGKLPPPDVRLSKRMLRWRRESVDEAIRKLGVR